MKKKATLKTGAIMAFMLIVVIAMVFPAPVAVAGVTQDWVKRYGGPIYAAADAYALFTDDSSNTYVTGGCFNAAGNMDFATVMYDTGGTQQWVGLYDSPGHNEDIACAIAVDTFHDICVVTGSTVTAAGGSDITTVCYKATGTYLWARSYDGPAHDMDRANCIAIDYNNGDVYVAGYSYNAAGNTDYIILKYNSSGTLLWTRRYNGPGHLNDQAMAIAVDPGGDVYVTGFIINTSLNGDYGTIKYNSSGVLQWVRRYDGTGHGDDVSRAIAIGAGGNICITGESPSLSPSCDYATVCYNSAGAVQWARRYNYGVANDDDRAKVIATDPSGNVYVTGWSKNAAGNNDYATIKYNNAGALKWARRYNGPGGHGDGASAIAVESSSGNVYVTGESRNAADTNYDYATVMYSTAGARQWVKRYYGSATGDDNARAISVDASGNAYVTGSSYNASGYRTFATIKYGP